MKTYIDTRDAIFEELYDIALKDKKVIVLSVDTAAMTFKKFKENIPSQFYNVGVAEQNAMSVAAGLAFTGYHVFIYGLANFVTLRCFEQIKIDIASMKLAVTILATGTGYFYAEDGLTHYMTDNLALLRILPGFTIWSPSSCSMAACLIHRAYEMNSPSCIWFDKGPFSALCEQSGKNFSDGANLIKSGKDALIISTGVMVGEALKVVEELEKSGIDAGALDLYCLKPLNKEFFLRLFKDVKNIITLEEHTVCGGLGSIICEFLAENDLLIPIKIFGIPDTFRCEVGNREELRSLDGINVSRVVENIKNWLK